MDSRQDEQERGITMKASAISLIHTKGTLTQEPCNIERILKLFMLR